MYIKPNGAEYRPEVDDVWAVPETPKAKFISHFVAYAQCKKLEEATEDDYFDKVWEQLDFTNIEPGETIIYETI